MSGGHRARINSVPVCAYPIHVNALSKAKTNPQLNVERFQKRIATFSYLQECFFFLFDKSVLLKLETVDRCGYVHVVSFTKTTNYQDISIKGSIFLGEAAAYMYI